MTIESLSSIEISLQDNPSDKIVDNLNLATIQTLKNHIQFNNDYTSLARMYEILFKTFFTFFNFRKYLHTKILNGLLVTM